MLEKIKSKVTNPFLKDNFTLDHIANFFANFVSGNQFINNLEVKDMADLNKLEVKESLKVKNEAEVENLSFNKLKSHALSIDDNEIVFDPEAILKLKSSKISFKVRDIFEVITFMKYIVKICGSKLERCDFNSLLENRTANQLMQLLATFEKKQTKYLENEKEKIQKLVDSFKVNNVNQPQKENLRKEKKVHNESTKLIQDSKLESRTGDKKIDKEESNDKSLEAIEKELNAQIKLSQSNRFYSESNDDYQKFLQNSQMANMINNYYYDIPQFIKKSYIIIIYALIVIISLYIKHNSLTQQLYINTSVLKPHQ